MAYTNSSLVSVTQISPNKNSPRNHAIDTITIHCYVGQVSVERGLKGFADPNRQASANYVIGTDGRIGLCVDEKDRSWCSSSKTNDNRAITIECASDNTYPYAFNDAVMQSLKALVVDICKRNGIKKLIWSDKKSDRVNHVNGCNMTVHRDFAAKSCIPTCSEVLTPTGWEPLSNVKVGDVIACADLDNLRISFEPVYDVVEPRLQDTYTNNGITATKDHRMVYRIQKNPRFRIDYFNNLLHHGNQIYIPCAGHADFDGLPLTDNELRYLIAVQADGHYMKDGGYYGVEFHLKKQRKIDRIKELLNTLGKPFTESYKSDGSVSIKIYGKAATEYCEQWLSSKNFTWDWLQLSPHQANIFIKELLLWDGCAVADLYTSADKINREIVCAIASMNGIGAYVSGNNVSFRMNPFITLGKDFNSTKRHNKRSNSRFVKVSCVSVKTGIFLCRQDGRTFLVGNCPGDWFYSREGKFADEVNEALNPAVVTTPPQTQTPTASSGTSASQSTERPYKYVNSDGYIINVFDVDKEWTPWFACGSAYATYPKPAYTAKVFAAKQNADICYNLALFSFSTKQTVTYVRTQEFGDVGYGGVADQIELSWKNKCGGYAVAIKAGVVQANTSKNKYLGGKSCRNGIGFTYDGRLIIAQSINKVTEAVFAKKVNTYIPAMFGTKVRLFLFEDGGGSTQEYSAISGLNFQPMGARPVPTVTCLMRRDFPKVTRTLQKGDTGWDVMRLQMVLGGICTDGSFGVGTRSRVKEYQKLAKLSITGVADKATLKSLGLM